MTFDQAKAHVEKILLRWALITGDRADECEIVTWGLDDYPDAGFRVAEITWSATGGPGDNFIWGGSSIMQSDLPEGLASCAAVERWIVGLMLNDAQITLDAKLDLGALTSANYTEEVLP